MDFPPLHESAPPFLSTGNQAFSPPQLSLASCLSPDGTIDVDKYRCYTASRLAKAMRRAAAAHAASVARFNLPRRPEWPGSRPPPGAEGGGGKTWWWKLCGREDTRRENYLGAIRKVRIPSIVDCDDTWGQHKKRLSCKHRGFTFWTKETEIGDKKKGGKKR